MSIIETRIASENEVAMLVHSLREAGYGVVAERGGFISEVDIVDNGTAVPLFKAIPNGAMYIVRFHKDLF